LVSKFKILREEIGWHDVVGITEFTFCKYVLSAISGELLVAVGKLRLNFEEVFMSLRALEHLVFVDRDLMNQLLNRIVKFEIVVGGGTRSRVLRGDTSGGVGLEGKTGSLFLASLINQGHNN